MNCVLCHSFFLSLQRSQNHKEIKNIRSKNHLFFIKIM